MGNHIVNGLFQSDKYPTTPAGKVPLSVKDHSAQDLLWIYAQRRRHVDAEFADDLETCLRANGYSRGFSEQDAIRSNRADGAARERGKVVAWLERLRDQQAVEEARAETTTGRTLIRILAEQMGTLATSIERGEHDPDPVPDKTGSNG